MTPVRRVGVLTVRPHPLLPYFLDELEALRHIETVLIFDEKDFSLKDVQIFRERTEGAFPARDLAPFLQRFPWVTVPDHNGQECRAIVTQQGIELLVNGGTPRRLTAKLIATPPFGVLNVHPGILPKYRGATCCEWAIYRNDPVGVTAHFMDGDLDSGPILFSRELPIAHGQRYVEVRVALYRLAFEVCVEAIRLILDRRLRPASLPTQPPAEVFKPIPDELLDVVKEKLLKGAYAHAR